MKVKMKIDDLNKAMSTLKLLFDSVVMQEDQKNIIFWNSGNGFKVVARNGIVDCICGIDAECDAEENEMVNVKYRELDSTINAFKSLSMTKATDIEFEFTKSVIDVTVYEEPVDTDYEFADKLYRSTSYKLSLVKSVADAVKKEILSVSLDSEGVSISGDDVLKYFNALIPTIKDIKQEGMATRYNVVGDYVYTAPQQYVAIMKNDIKDFSDFILTKATAEFVKVFFGNEANTNVYITETESGTKMIRLTNSSACALIKAQGTGKAFAIDAYKSIPNTGVAVDKKYFCDVLKRMDPTNPVKLTVTEEEITISQARATCSVPVLLSRLSDDADKFAFSTNIGTLSNLVFAHFNAGDRLFIYVQNNNNRWDVTFTDDSQAIDGSHLWWTRVSFRKT